MENGMSYFKKAKVDDRVFGLIFGKGKIAEVFDNDHFFKLKVEFDDGDEVFFTIEGVPNVSNIDYQTLFFEDDKKIQKITEYERLENILSEKKVLKLYKKGILEYRTKSGIWIDSEKVPKDMMWESLANGALHHFRKKKIADFSEYEEAKKEQKKD
jgi:hypothetical protein